MEQYPYNQPRSQRIKDTAFRTFAIVGIVVVLSALAWGAIRVAPRVGSLVAQAFVGLQSVFIPADTLTLSTNTAPLVDGEPFSLSWEHRDGETPNGSYAFLYDCAMGLHFETPDGDTLFCNEVFRFVNNDNTLTLIPRLTVNETVRAEFEIRFSENGSDATDGRGKRSLNVVTEVPVETPDDTSGTPSGGGTPPGTIPGTPSSTVEQFATTTIPGTPAPSDPNGIADLAVRPLGTGIIDRDTNTFVATTTIRQTSRTAVRFEVTNLGTKETGQWRFAAALPTEPFHIFNSKGQRTLHPGDRIEFTLGFDAIRDLGTNEIRINLDPQKNINESRDDNNLIAMTVTVVK